MREMVGTQRQPSVVTSVRSREPYTILLFDLFVRVCEWATFDSILVLYSTATTGNHQWSRKRMDPRLFLFHLPISPTFSPGWRSLAVVIEHTLHILSTIALHGRSNTRNKQVAASCSSSLLARGHFICTFFDGSPAHRDKKTKQPLGSKTKQTKPNSAVPVCVVRGPSPRMVGRGGKYCNNL